MRLPVLLCLLCACSDATVTGPRIESADPDPADPGGDVEILGVGFGEDGHVGVGGRPVAVRDWEAERIVVALPDDIGGGPAQVVVVAAGRPSPPHTIEIAGPRVDRPPPDRTLQPPDPRRDVGPPPPDDGPPPSDMDRVPDAAQDLVAELSPDPAGDGLVYLDGGGDGPGGLVVTVHLGRALVPDAWGVALHLRYDRNLLRFEEAAPALDQRFHVTEIAPGRLALGRVLPGGDDLVARLRFALVGRGEGRIDIAPRHRTVRGPSNEPIPGVRWAGGSVRVVRE